MKAICSYCKKEIEANIPFISKNYYGFTSKLCPCGKSTTKKEIAYPRTKVEQNSWNEVLDLCELEQEYD